MFLRRLIRRVPNFIPKCRFSNPKYSPEVMNQLKKDAMNFYQTNEQPNIIDLNNVNEWETQVVKSTQPVVLLCSAKWSDPSKEISAVLEKKLLQDKNGWKLVRLDIDAMPQIATALQVPKYNIKTKTFQINQLPTVILISKGKSIDGFKGMPTPQQLNNFYASLAKFIGGESWEEHQMKLYELLEQKDSKAMNAKVQELQKTGKWNKHIGELKIFETYAASIEGNWQRCVELLKEFDSKFSDYLEEEHIKELYDELQQTIDQFSNMAKQDMELSKLLNKLDSEPANCSLRYEISEYCYKQQFHQEAIRQLLDLMKIDRSWEDRKAQTMLLKIFSELGSSNTLTIEGRKQLVKILY